MLAIIVLLYFAEDMANAEADHGEVNSSGQVLVNFLINKIE